MEKLRKASKRIAAVGAATAIVASSIFGAGLSDYPNNFVKNDKFEGKVVVGTGMGADDATAANSIIEDLKAQFSGDVEQVRITYRKVAEGGDAVSGVDDKSTLNIGETLNSVKEELDKDVSDLLEDGSLDDNDYTQELVLLNGSFDYRIFDEVDGEEVAKAGLYYDANQGFAKYILDFEDEPEIDTAAKRTDLVGEEMSIMGNEFTVVEIDDDQLTLIGGSNKISLGEGESTKVSVEGKSYDVSVQSVSDTKVLLTVNGQSRSIDLHETDELAGVSIAVTDLVSSSRDAVKGYAEVVVGGQKVELTSSKVKINDEDLDDVYDDYEVDVTFSGSDNTVFEGIEIVYKVDENVVLEEGDSLDDVLFDSFSLVYDGTNDVEYSEFKITSSKDEVAFSGNIHDGSAMPTEFKLTTDDGATDDLYLGSDSERVYFKESDLAITTLVTAGSMDAITYSGGDVVLNVSAATTDVKGNMFFTREDDDEFYLYEITGVDKDDLELDFSDLFADKDTNAVDINDVQTALEWSGAVASDDGNGNLTMDLANLGNSVLYLENELQMDFSAAEEHNFNATSTTVRLGFDYNSDIEMDDTGYKTDAFTINIQRAADSDDAIELSINSTHNFVNNGAAGDKVDEDSDFEVYVDHYGTKVTIDTEDKDDVTIEVPDKELEAKVSVVFGDAGATEMSKTVSSDDLEDEKAKLKEDGYTIVKTETLAASDVTIDIAGTVADTEVADVEDMIVVGGPAVNAVARELLGIESYTVDQAGVMAGEGVVRYFADSNTVLVYGYSKEDTKKAVDTLNAGGLSGDQEKVQ